MKNTLKKATVIMMTFVLLVGALAVPSPKAQAASALTKADFKFTGKYKSYFNTVIKTNKDWYYAMSNTIDESNPKKCIKTKRGITLTSTKDQVFSKYGKKTLKKLGKGTKLYKRFKKNQDARALKQLNNTKYAMYPYEPGSNDYKIYFFFNKKNKVEIIIACKNC